MHVRCGARGDPAEQGPQAALNRAVRLRGSERAALRAIDAFAGDVLDDLVRQMRPDRTPPSGPQPAGRPLTDAERTRAIMALLAKTADRRTGGGRRRMSAADKARARRVAPHRSRALTRVRQPLPAARGRESAPPAWRASIHIHSQHPKGASHESSRRARRAGQADDRTTGIHRRAARRVRQSGHRDVQRARKIRHRHHAPVGRAIRSDPLPEMPGTLDDTVPSAAPGDPREQRPARRRRPCGAPARPRARDLVRHRDARGRHAGEPRAPDRGRPGAPDEKPLTDAERARAILALLAKAQIDGPGRD